jgi:outer membrane cobalamin receptor
MFKGTSFSTGGYSAEYGQALSSALVLDSKDKSELSRTDFGILSVGGDVGHTQVWDRGSIGGKVQYTNLEPYAGLVRQEIDWIKAPQSLEGSAAFRQQVGDDGLLKLYGNFNRSRLSLYQHSIDDISQKSLLDLTNEYEYLNGSYKNVINDDWNLRGGVSYTQNKDKIIRSGDEIFETTTGVHVKAVTEGSLADQIEMRAGVESILTSYRENILSSLNGALHSVNEVILSSFLEADVYVSNEFVLRAGGRVEHNNLSGKLSVDPRVSVAHKVGAHGQASLAYGKFRQSPNTDYLKRNDDLFSERADHYIVSYQFARQNKTFRIESYYKSYSDLIKYFDGDAQTLTNDGGGEAKGIELFWRDNASFQNLDYWCSYSFLDTERDYLHFPYEAVPSFASTHNFSIVAKYFIRPIKSQMGFTYSFASGRPYNDPNVDEFNGRRTPNYADVSFNWSFLPTTSVIIYFSCTNLLGRDNIFGYEFSETPNQDGTFNGRAIRQPAPRFLFLGIFITLSKDKSVNQLPNL